MKAKVIFWLVFPAFLIVIIWSLHAVNKSHHEVEQDLEIRALQDKADIALRILDRLKTNDTNTVIFLERQLDITVVSLGKTLETIPESQWDTSSLRILRVARDYHRRFPRAQLDPGLVQTFSLLDRATNN